MAKRWRFPESPRTVNLKRPCAAILALAGFAVTAGVGLAAGREADDIAARAAVAALGSAALGAVLGALATRILARGEDEGAVPGEPEAEDDQARPQVEAGAEAKRKVE